MKLAVIALTATAAFAQQVILFTMNHLFSVFQKYFLHFLNILFYNHF